MSCSLESPFCQGPYAKLQLESQREPLAPGSPLWSGMCHSMLQRCGNVLLDTIFLRKYFDAKVSASKLDHTRVNTRLLNIHMVHMCGLESLCSMFDKGCGQEKPGPTPQEFCFGSHDVVS